MAYTKTIWSTGDTITASLANKWETQWEESKASYESGEWSPPSNVETPQGAQAKADEAEQNANAYTESYAEPKFTKNTAFNKDFGTSAGTVAEGNHMHPGSDITSPVASAVQADNADTLDGKHASDFQNGNKIYGNAHYTDMITAGTTLTKTIPLGGIYYHGMLVVYDSSQNRFGILVHFGTDNLKTLMVGFYQNSDEAAHATSRRKHGSVTSIPYSGIGYYTTGRPEVKITEIYISGTNLRIDFENTDVTNDLRIDCEIDWEVW